MKTIFRSVTVLTLVIACLVVIAPTNSHAVEAKSGACTTLPATQTNYQAAATKRLATMNDDFAKRISNITNRDKTVDPKIDAARAAAATKFDEAIVKLNAQSGLTTAQTKAITTYESQTKAAEKIREEAVDAARATYRTSLVGVVQQHQAALSTAATTFQSAVSTAFTTAIANCTSTTAKSTLKATIASAKATFATARQSAKVTDQIKQLMQTRDTVIKTADETFAKTAATYSATLSAVLDVTASPTPSTSSTP